MSTTTVAKVRSSRIKLRKHCYTVLATIAMVTNLQLSCPSAMAQQTNAPINAAAENNANVSTRALDLVYEGNEKGAKDLLIESSKSQTLPLKEQADILYFLAALESRDNELAECSKHLTRAKDLLAQDNKLDVLQQVLLSKRLGDCLYKSNNIKDALAQYKAALFILNQTSAPLTITDEEILEGIVACDLQLKDFSDAESEASLLVSQATNRLQRDPTAVISLVWAMFLLSDVYRVTNQQDKLTELKAKLRPLLSTLVQMRMDAASQQGGTLDYQTIIRNFRQHYVQELRPQSPAEVVWAAADFRERTLPIIGWKSTTGSPRAIVLCIHGLGLENKAFEPTALQLNRRGYEVYALDVRGFGSWTLTRGLEEIDYAQTTADIAAITQTLKAQAAGLPVFVLGESMGGAIALRAAADLGKAIDGVISSVPSAERFQANRMALQTTLHFLGGPKKAFDVGYVAERATADETRQTQWKEDPRAKLRLTPIELTEFAIFMRKTKPQAEKITELPVLMVQGLGDKLVKPEGTFKLFDAVSSPDKTLLLVGLAEHLMFESAKPDEILLDTVDSWITHHLPNRP